MNTNKQTLIESINKQRKLMGLNEIMDVNANIDAKGALSGNKLDLGMVPLEEMEPEDDDLPAIYRMYNSDDWVRAQRDAMGLDDEDEDERSDDEMDFYRGEDPMSLDDRMDMKYPDPNERDFELNRYSRRDEMMNEGELDELFGTGIGAGIAGAFKGIGQNFKTGRVTQQIKNSEAKFAKVIAQANAYLTKNEKIFNELMAHQKTLASLSANDPNKKSLETILTNSKATWDALKKTLAGATQQINQFNQATAGTAGAAGATGGQTNQPAAGGGQTGQTGGQTNQPAAGGNQNLAQSGQTAPAFKAGQKVQWTSKKGNQTIGTVINDLGNGYTQVQLQGGGTTSVPNQNLQTR